MHKPEIDGLRAIAVISVIINHIDRTILPNGHLGVDVFYVISGFVITKSLANKQHGSLGRFILDFYNRRAKRLVPALFLCVAITWGFSFLLIPPYSNLSDTATRTGIYSLFGLSNLYLLSQATDYFGSSAELNPFTHTWSLGVEEQFYLLFPFLIWFGGLSNGIKPRKLSFQSIIIVLSFISLVSYILLSKINPTLAFYLMPLRFWELGIGSMTYIYMERTSSEASADSGFLKPVAAITLAAIIATFMLTMQRQQQELITVVIVLLTAVLIASVRPMSLTYKLMTLRAMVFLGGISYSLYLWHWSVLTIGRWTIGVNLWTIPFQSILILLLAYLSHRFVEIPLRYSDWNIARIGKYFKVPAVVQSILAAFSLSIVIFALVIPLHRNGYLYTGTIAPLIKKGVKTLQDRQDSQGYSWTAAQCVLSSNRDVGKIIDFENCTFGDFKSSRRRFLVIGDSFGAAAIEMLQGLHEEERGSLTVTSSWGASPVPEIENNTRFGKANDYYWHSVVPALFSRLRAGDVVLMINNGADFSPRDRIIAPDDALERIHAGLSRISDELSKRGVSLIYQSGLPFLRDSNCTPDMAMHQWWHFWNEPPCTYYRKDETIARRGGYHDTLLKVQAEHKNFFVLDLMDIYCPDDVCRLFDSTGMFLYRDEWSHASVEANLRSRRNLLDVVDRIIGSDLSHDLIPGGS